MEQVDAKETGPYKFGMWMLRNIANGNASFTAASPLTIAALRAASEKMETEYANSSGGFLIHPDMMRGLDVAKRFWDLMEDAAIKETFDAGYFAARKRVSVRAFKNYCKKRAEREIPEVSK